MVGNCTSVLLTIPQENIEGAHLGGPIHICDGLVLAVLFIKEGPNPLHPHLCLILHRGCSCECSCSFHSFSAHCMALVEGMVRTIP